MKKASLFFSLLSLCTFSLDSEPQQKQSDTSKMIISTVITDLRVKPKPVVDLKGQDMLQDSQLLFGEHINVLKKDGDWLYIEALEQIGLDSTGAWGLSKGWIAANTALPTSEFLEENAVVKAPWSFLYAQGSPKIAITKLSCGTKLKIEGPSSNNQYVVIGGDGNKYLIGKKSIRFLSPQKDEAKVRSLLVKTARQFIGMPYSWGGRSSYYHELKDERRTSVDCSGLTNLCYRVAGITIPRNSGAQYKKSRAIEGKDLKVGDLIFLSRGGSAQKIGHVMLYAGNDSCIEARGGDVQKVRFSTGFEDFGKKFETIKSAETCGDYTLYFGTYW